MLCYSSLYYAICYSVIIHVDTGLQELYVLLLVRWEYTVQCDGDEKTYYASWSVPESESIGGTEINLTVCAVSNGVLCCNLAESKSVLKMCISKHCHEVTGFLSWIETYFISYVVQQRRRVKDLSFLDMMEVSKVK